MSTMKTKKEDSFDKQLAPYIKAVKKGVHDELVGECIESCGRNDPRTIAFALAMELAMLHPSMSNRWRCVDSDGPLCVVFSQLSCGTCPLTPIGLCGKGSEKSLLSKAVFSEDNKIFDRYYRRVYQRYVMWYAKAMKVA